MTMTVVLLFAAMALAGCIGGGGGDNDQGGGGGTPQATVTASPLTPRVGEPLSFRASQAQATDTASWQFGDGQNGTGVETTHTYTSPGNYVVLLNLTRGSKSATNDAALTYITVTAANLELANVTEETPPVVVVAASSQVVEPNTEVRFDANGSGAWVANPDFDPTNIVQSPAANPPFTPTGEVDITWDFGDGSSGEGMTVSHTFVTAGLYAVKATATGESGKTGTYFVTVRVLPDLPSGETVRNPATFLTATIGEPESLDPAYDYETAGGTVLQQVYETLYFYKRDAADQLEGRVAASYPPEISSDGKELTIDIRQGIKFHDGTDLTADDVVFSLNRLLIMNDPDGPAWIYYSIAGADEYASSDMTAEDRQTFLDAGGVTKVDDYTVKIKLAYPDPAFPFKLAFNAASIVSKDGVCAQAESDFVDCYPPPGQTRHPWMDTHEVGSGPWVLDAWIPGQQVILKRYEQYWDQARKPKLEKVILQKVEDVNTRLLMLFSGQADDVYVPVDHDVDVVGKAGIRIVENPSWTVGFLGFNQKFCGGPNDPGFSTCMATNGGDAPKKADGSPDPLFFSDIHMRKAWTYAFDYETYLRDILKNHGKMLNGPLPEGIFGYDATIPRPQQDMAKAVEEFKLTNNTGGFSITLYYNSGNTVREKTTALMAQNLEQMCRQAGTTCDVKTQGLDWSTAFLPKQRARALPVFYLGWAPDYAYPDNYVVTFAHSQKGVYSKRVGYANPALDEKLDALVQELDENKAKQGWSEAVKMLNDDYVFLWLAQGSNYHVEREWVKGYYYNPMHSGGPNIGDYSTISKG